MEKSSHSPRGPDRTIREMRDRTLHFAATDIANVGFAAGPPNIERDVHIELSLISKASNTRSQLTSL
jgi:hypothetical protein